MQSIVAKSISCSSGFKADESSLTLTCYGGIFLRYLVKHRVAAILTEMGKFGWFSFSMVAVIIFLINSIVFSSCTFTKSTIDKHEAKCLP